MFVELDSGIEFMFSVTIWAGLCHGFVTAMSLSKSLTVAILFDSL